MVSKMIILALCVVAAMGSAVPHAAKYPAGVNPHACPNYPYCDNVALAAHGAHGAHAVAPYAAATYGAYGHHAGVHGAAAAYPAGVDPHTCPNYPYCDNVALAVHATGAAHGYAGGWAGAHGGLAGAHGGLAGAHGVLAGAHGAWAVPALAAHGAWAGAHHGAWAGAHHGAAHGAGAHYPAGVDPHTCPNYPYCH